MAALSGEPKSKEKAGFSRGREGPWAWPLPCACLFASTPSLAPAQSRWPARRRRRLRGVLSSSDAHPLDLPGPLLEAQSLLNRTHEHARARGLLIQVPRAAGVRVLRCGSVRRAVRGLVVWAVARLSAELHSAVPCSPGSVRPRRVVTGETIPAPYVEL